MAVAFRFVRENAVVLLLHRSQKHAWLSQDSNMDLSRRDIWCSDLLKCIQSKWILRACITTKCHSACMIKEVRKVYYLASNLIELGMMQFLFHNFRFLHNIVVFRILVLSLPLGCALDSIHRKFITENWVNVGLLRGVASNSPYDYIQHEKTRVLFLTIFETTNSRI